MTNWTRSRWLLCATAIFCAGLLTVDSADAQRRRRTEPPPGPETNFAEVARDGCSGEQITPTELGAILRQRCPLPALTDQDYGRVEIRFDPPSASSTITRNELRNTIGAQLDRNLLPDARSATLVLDISSRSETGAPVRLTSVPLMSYEFSEREGMRITTDRSLIDAPVTDYFLIDEESTTIVVSTRLAFSTDTKPQIVQRLAQVTAAAVDFGGHGWLANAMRTPGVSERLSGIESLFVSGLSISERATVDMRFREDGWTRLTYRFGTDPRNLNTDAFGTLTVSLTRSPSVFTGTRVENRRANFGVTQPDQYARYRSDDVITFLSGNDGTAPSEFSAFNATTSGVTAFESACRQVWRRLDSVALSAADQRALFWALTYQTDNRRRRELWTADSCLSVRREESANFGLLIPAEQAPTPVTDSERDVFFGRAAGVFRTGTFADRQSLFAELVDIDFAPDTIYPAERTPRPGSAESRNSVAGMIEDIPMQAGCRFANPPAAAGIQSGQQMGFLVRLLRSTDNNQVLTAVVRMVRPSGQNDIFINGIALRPTTAEDWAAIRRQPGLFQRCYSGDPAVALPLPVAPGTAPVVPPQP